MINMTLKWWQIYYRIFMNDIDDTKMANMNDIYDTKSMVDLMQDIYDT